jgi:hypothetical protein
MHEGALPDHDSWWILRGEKRDPPIRFVAGEQARMGGNTNLPNH